MMRSPEGRQSQPGTAFHTKNTVICHILSRLCLNVTPVLITRLTKLFCSSGLSASVLTERERNWRKLLTGLYEGRRWRLWPRGAMGEVLKAWCSLVFDGPGCLSEFCRDRRSSLQQSQRHDVSALYPSGLKREDCPLCLTLYLCRSLRPGNSQSIGHGHCDHTTVGTAFWLIELFV